MGTARRQDRVAQDLAEEDQGARVGRVRGGVVEDRGGELRQRAEPPQRLSQPDRPDRQDRRSDTRVHKEPGDRIEPVLQHHHHGRGGHGQDAPRRHLGQHHGAARAVRIR